MENSNQTPQAQEINSQMPSPVSKSNNTKLLIFILTAITITLVAIAAYALGSKQNQPVVQNIVQPTPIPSPTVAIDETANWKMYTNTNYGFEVKYPNNWIIEAPYAGPDPTGYDFAVQISNVKNPFGISCGETEQETGINPCASNQAVYIFIRNLSLHSQTFQDVIRSNSKSGEQKTVVINELNFIKVGEVSPMYFIQNGNIAYSLSTMGGNEIFDQILATFKFTDENLDGKVWVDIDQIGAAINIYYFDNKKLPQNLEALTMHPGLNYFKLNNNPYTGKPYQFTTKSDGSGFILSGTVRDGTEYKKEFPIK